MSAEDEANAQQAVEGTSTWPELVARIYDELGANGSPTIRLSGMDVHVPSRTGDDADRAHWTVDGEVELNPTD